jgi:hypothetical protein
MKEQKKKRRTVQEEPELFIDWILSIDLCRSGEQVK